MDKPWTTLRVAHNLPTGRRLPTSSTALDLIGIKSGKVKTIAPVQALAYSNPVAVQATVTTAGVDAFGVRNRLKIMMATNERWVIPASEDERRYCVLEISDTKRGDHAYFGALDRHMREGGLSALLHHLLSLDLSDFNIRAVPNTEALEKQKLLSLSPLMMWLHERLYEGCFRAGENGWVTEQERDTIAAEFAEFAQRKGGRYVCTDKRTIGEQLRAVFPELGEARRSKGGRRPRLWLFPELDDARAQFSRYFGLEHTRWPEVEE